MTIISDDAKSIDKSEKINLILIVNGRDKEWNDKEINFEEVVKLAFGSVNSNPNVCYTVTYKKGPGQNREGSMVQDDVVRVKNKMIFNVTSTDKS